MSEQLTKPLLETHKPVLDEYQQSAFLTSADRKWLEKLGASWPRPEQEAVWLSSLNDIIELGSIHINKNDKEIIVGARETFLGQLSFLTEQTKINLKAYGYQRFTPLNNVIESQRLLDANNLDIVKLINNTKGIRFTPGRISTIVDSLKAFGLDTVKVINTFPGIFSYAPDALKAKFDNLSDLGLDAIKVVNSYPRVMWASPRSIKVKLDNLTNLGLDATRLVNAYPNAISYSLEKVKASLDNLANLGLAPTEIINLRPWLIKFDAETIKAKLNKHSVVFDIDKPPVAYHSAEAIDTKLAKLSNLGLDASRITSAYPKGFGIASESYEARLNNLSAHGLNAKKVINAYPIMLSFPPESTDARLDNLTKLGLDSIKIANTFPPILTYAPESIKAKFENLTSYGLDAANIINARPVILSYAPESVRKKIEILYESAKMWGLSNPILTINKLVEDLPGILDCRPDRIRTLARIITGSILDISDEAIQRKNIRPMIITNLEKILVGYLEHRREIRKVEDIARLGFRYYKFTGNTILRKIIATHTDDPAVQTYMEGYPLNNLG